MNLVRGVSRALGGSKAVRLQLCVNIDAIANIDSSESTVVELERGKHKVQADTCINDENVKYVEDAFQVPLTLFRDSKKGFKSKYFTIRVKSAKDSKKVLADMGQLDVATYAKVEGPTTMKIKSNNNVSMSIRVECVFIEEAGDIDDCSTIGPGGIHGDQDLDGFDDPVVREELHAGNFTRDNGEDIFDDVAPTPSSSSLSMSPSSSIPRKRLTPRKDKAAARTSKQSASPYRSLGAVEELARQLRVAKGERDDALHKYMEAQKLIEGGGDGTTIIQTLTTKCEENEKLIEEMKVNARKLEVELADVHKSKEQLQQSIVSKDSEIARYITDFNTLKGTSIAQQSESTSRLEALELRLKESTQLTQASSDDQAKTSNTKIKSLQEVADSLREQLELTRRAHSEAKDDLSSLTKERNELKEQLKTSETVTRSAVTRASTAELSLSRLEDEMRQLESDRAEESEMADTREGAMRATAQFRIKELEEGMSSLASDHEKALGRAAELEKSLTALQKDQTSADALKEMETTKALLGKAKLEHASLLNDLSKLLDSDREEGQDLVELLSAKISGLEAQVKELTISLEKIKSEGGGDALAKLKEKFSALQLEREGAARNLLKLQKEYDILVQNSKNDKEKEALHESVVSLEKKLKEEVLSRDKALKAMEKVYNDKLAKALDVKQTNNSEKEMKQRERAVASQEAALQYNQLRAADKEEEMLQLVVSAKLSYAQAKEELDSLRRENIKLAHMCSDVKGQLANVKAAHEDMEASCQHALAGNKANLAELEAYRKRDKRSSFSMFK